MGLVLTTTLGLIVWVVLWSLGAKGFDAFMITTLIVTLGATAHMLKGNVPDRDG